MKGGDISMHRNGLLMEHSSAVLDTLIRYAAIAEERQRLNHVTEQTVTQTGMRGERSKKEKLFPSLINQAVWLKYSHPLPSVHSCYSAAQKNPNFQSPKCPSCSPWASKAGKTWMGGLIDERRDDALHHVRQYSEGGNHNEVYEPWRQRHQRIYCHSKYIHSLYLGVWIL